MPGRIIAIGDVHACFLELEKLLEKLSLCADDQVVMLGDIVNRGPGSHRVVTVCKRIGALCIMGNHERRLLRARRKGNFDDLNPVDRHTFDSLDAEDWEYLEGALPYFEIPGQGVVFVHGGFMPGRDWRYQEASILTGIQVIDAKGRPRKRADAPPQSPHWSDLWVGPPFVVYGHTPWHEVRRNQWTLGLDTGCVYGGALSALILPGFEVVQQRAMQVYFPSPFSWGRAGAAAPAPATPPGVA
jgi:hypothetical protein